MTEQPPDPAEGQQADINLIKKVVFECVKYAEWTSTGGAIGCTLCKDRNFAERVAAGGRHVTCAQEMARAEGAVGIRHHLIRGDLDMRLYGVVTDPRLGEWRRHLDQWAETQA